MTNHWIDIGNSDCVMIIGSNAAENHPLSFKWVMRAVEKGAKIIHIDPRFTRTSSKAHIYAPLRSGTDMAFIGGLVRYTIENKLYHEEYIREYTDATFLVDTKFGFQDGLFTGFDAAKRSYDKKAGAWSYQMDEQGNVKTDPTMQDPNCVFQLLKKHFADYTPEKVNEVTGMPKEKFLEVARTYCATGAANKTGTIMYAMGATQHTYGSQNTFSYCVLQLLLGNMGVAGGGINALRGESNVQGATDHGLLFHILTGYLKTPRANNTTLAAYNEQWTPKTIGGDKSANWWQNTPKYIVSLLKAYWGAHATKDNEFDYQFLPKIDEAKNYSWIALFEAMYEGKIKGLMVMGMNPAVSGPNSRKERKALEKLEWMAAADLWVTETMEFWKAPGVDPKKIQTEVFALPAASSVEKEGSITNSGRWMQWRYKAVEPVGLAHSDSWIVDKIFRTLRDEYKQGGAFPDPILNLTWNYGEHEEPDVHLIAKEINGYAMEAFTHQDTAIKEKEQIASFGMLKDDGKTACGCWIYCGSYTEKGNMAARRVREDAPNNLGLYPQWAWAWPLNRRIIYNRASCDPTGKPWDPNRALVRWDAEQKKWIGDVPDGPWPPEAKYPFIMVAHGHARFFATDLADGPLFTHYEPIESPVKNALYAQDKNPVAKIWTGEFCEIGTADKFPIIGTTYRVVEHWQAGQMTRNLTWVSELMPDMFVEISNELAKEKGIQNGDKVRVKTARGSISVYAVVTHRFKPFKMNGRVVHEIGLPWHWGYSGIAIGESANILTPHVGDANTSIPEYKAFLCDIEKEAQDG